jgi:regulator of protease activity HflC (stomatin/prohibitin superfamily)
MRRFFKKAPPDAMDAAKRGAIAEARSWRYLLAMLVLRIVGSLIVVGVALARTNPYVPPGHEGYIYERPRVFGNGGFQGTLRGPANFGLSLFRNEAINIDMRAQTYSEPFNLLAQDDLSLTFRFHAVLAVKSGSVARVVDDFGGTDWYARYVKETFRTFIRDAALRHRGTDLKKVMRDCEESVRADLERYLDGTPFELIRLVVGDIEYPAAVAEAVDRKLAAAQLLHEKGTQEQITVWDAQIAAQRAMGRAEAQRLISSTLTERLLQYEAIKAQRELGATAGASVVYVPVGVGGVPIPRARLGAP